MWANLPIEHKMFEKLHDHIGAARGETLQAAYITTRANLVENILSEIAHRQPDLTDHSAAHVRAVMDKCGEILGDKIDKLSGVELYVLMKAALFHDVGNYYARENHENNIAEIYDFACGGHIKKQEKKVIQRIVKAHSGLGIDSTKDTLKDLDLEDQVENKIVRQRELAAILRFADELAEGRYRTSSFAVSRGDYDEVCQKYHEYADCIETMVDRGNERIVLTYNVNIQTGNKTLSRGEEKRVKKLLEFIYSRVVKLDEERQFNKYYCGYLSVFKSTDVSITFFFNNALAEQSKIKFALDDKVVVPGDGNYNIKQRVRQFDDSNDPKEVVKSLRAIIKRTV